MVSRTKRRVDPRIGVLAGVLALPGCAGGLGLGDETAGQATSGSEGTGSGDPTGSGDTPTGPQDTTIDEPTGSTTGGPDSDGDESSGSSSTGDDTTTGPELPHPEVYPLDRTHSPISAYVAERMRAIAAAPAGADKDPHVFAKIGGTSTASSDYMACFAVDAAIQDLPAELMTSLLHFRMADLGGVTAFNRQSLAAMNGWSTSELVSDMAAPIVAELAAIHPRFAQLLVGTHDLEEDQPAHLWVFADQLLDSVDALIGAGVVPILSTIPQRSDLPLKDPFVTRYNLVVRAIAQGRQVPLVDLHRELAPLPNLGVLEDGELSVFVSANLDRPCHFSESALMFGYNVRNLEGLRALDRARQVVVDAAPELDPAGPALAGVGTTDDPIVVSSLPFVDLRSTADSPSDALDAYAGACDEAKDESGPERVYRLEVEDDITVRVMVFDRGDVDVDVHVLSEVTAGTCIKRNDREVTGPLPSGTYYIVIDSFAGNVPSGASGEYALIVMAE